MPCPNHPEVTKGLAACNGCWVPYCPDCLVELHGRRYCAECKLQAVKDVQSGAPAALDMRGRLAGILARFAAIFIDGLILAPATVGLFFAVFGTAFFRTEGPTMALGRQLLYQVLAMTVYLLYEGIMLQKRGQTVGKIALGIKVVNPDGSDIRPGQAWLRPFMRAILNMCWLVDYIPALFMKERTCIHDLVAKTRVIKIR